MKNKNDVQLFNIKYFPAKDSEIRYEVHLLAFSLDDAYEYIAQRMGAFNTDEATHMGTVHQMTNTVAHFVHDNYIKSKESK